MFNKQNQWGWLDALARKWGLGEALTRQQGVFAWRRAVGQQLARWARPLYVSQGVLHLAVFNYAAASQLKMLETQLLEALREVAPESDVRRLRLHVQPEARAPLRRCDTGVAVEDLARAEQLVPSTLAPSLREQLLQSTAQACAQERAIMEAGGRRCSCCGVAFLGEEELCPLCIIVGAPEGD